LEPRASRCVRRRLRSIHLRDRRKVRSQRCADFIEDLLLDDSRASPMVRIRECLTSCLRDLTKKGNGGTKPLLAAYRFLEE
jgi:hypothetical protein